MTAHTNRGLTLDHAALLVGGTVIGEGSTVIKELAGMAEAQEGDITFLANSKYLRQLKGSKASAALLSNEMYQLLQDRGESCSKAVVLVKNADLARVKLLAHLHPQERMAPPGIHETAVLGRDVELGEDIALGAYVVVGDGCSVGDGSTVCAHTVISAGCRIGANTLIYPHVTLYPGCKVGNNVIIHAGAVIGSDGFGYVPAEGRYHKIPQVGHLVIEDDVEIGANTTVDRGALGVTRIGRGAKVDNLVQIAHNVEVDEHAAFAAQTGISGSTKIGKWVRIGGQAGLAGHIEVGDGATIGAQAGVTKSVPPGSMVSGYPAMPHMLARRIEASQHSLPRLLKRTREGCGRLSRLCPALRAFPRCLAPQSRSRGPGWRHGSGLGPVCTARYRLRVAIVPGDRTT
jgi:UDP-3-O-[3-hydroxymyristoyl] glucosamine N-acyltransferase